jgi:hypothetical protein
MLEHIELYQYELALVSVEEFCDDSLWRDEAKRRDEKICGGRIRSRGD